VRIRIDAVLFDLDDTMFPQSAWLEGAWQAVARAAETLGADRAALLESLTEIAAEGSDRGLIINRALAACGYEDIPVRQLVEVFLAHAPESLPAYPGACEAVALVRELVPVALVTDGNPGVQRAKIRALGLSDAFDTIVFSDEMGRDKRKPDPASMLDALTTLSVPANVAVYIGDRPEKDMAAANAAGMRTIRVLTGEYARAPGIPPAWLTTADVVDAVGALALHLYSRARL
jgi:putative hydrolase of the HAD superfamily